MTTFERILSPLSQRGDESSLKSPASGGSRAAIIYHSSEGQTRRISERIAQQLGAAGLEVDLFPLNAAPRKLADYALVVVAGSVHYSRHDSKLGSFAGKHAKELAAIRSAFVSVSLAASSSDPKRAAPARQYVADFLKGTSWNPDVVEMFAGALRYSQYGLLKKQLLRFIALKNGLATDVSRDHEYTRWNRVDELSGDLASLVRTAA